jgi:hypothetical protein
MFAMQALAQTMPHCTRRQLAVLERYETKSFGDPITVSDNSCIANWSDAA